MSKEAGMRLLWFLWYVFAVLGRTAISKHPMKSIQSPDGFIIDCILIKHQPAFDHPLLNSTNIQTSPSIPIKAKYNTSIQQLWHQAGEECPDGTIPVQRERVLNIRNLIPSATSSENRHEYAIAEVKGVYYGAQALLNVWQPYVEDDREMSISQMWVTASYGDLATSFNSLEVGWQVYPLLYGDRRPRLFIYWTRDTYRSTGCYNLRCQGFVQINKKIVLGGSIYPISTLNGDQRHIYIAIFKDYKTGNWWLQCNGDVIGYWPKEIVLSKGWATSVQWGGEIVDVRAHNRHTKTQMGSGMHANGGFGKASFVKELRVIDEIPLAKQLRWQTMNEPHTDSTSPNCYDISSCRDATCYFGGPGFGPACP